MSQDTPEPTPPVSQFRLLRQRRFAPYFVTQLLGAFNDNVYKNALVALIAFASINSSSGDDSLLINLAAGLFILPFFLFSALFGQVADKYEKSTLIRYAKLSEIGIMSCGVVALTLNSMPLLLAVLFLMGTQSAFFGPVKYGILPQHLSESELTGGNGLVELGTFLAILFGTIAGTQLIAKSATGSVVPVSIVLMLVAIAGYFVSRKIPSAPASAPSLRIRFNPLTETVNLVRSTSEHRIIFQSILAISWFWFLGAVYLAQFPVYARDVLGGSVDVFTLLLGTFSVGIAMGSILCERMSSERVEIGLVPFGAMGLTLFGLDLVWATPAAPLGSGLAVMGFIGAAGAWRVLLDIFLIGLFGGFYIVPLYALIQKTSAPDRLSRAIACNNILNALFMVLSALLALAVLAMGASIAQLFLLVAVLNAVVALYIFRQVPEFFMRFLIWLLIHTLYRVRKQDMHLIPQSGAAIVVANHVSFVDALLLGGCIKRPVRFVMYYKIYNIPVLNFIFRTAKAIPIAGRSEDEALYEQAFERMKAALEQGELLCIFPEGQITQNGQMSPLRPGILRVLEAQPVPVVPIALQGLWGSLFSRKGGPAFFKLPRRIFARIGLIVGKPMPADSVTLDALEVRLRELRGDWL
ncbi:MFS transporter [Granulosicoccus antarcticus]|uniref:Lysophospholipid transporter LplT n=1 Tax=Granulosicoccus antarcticus IMCC3135 TaxID=1192854 RepID=A0A2Z2P7L9_9GAMM|nr:MFS transporter [Granulosicoccus antarcticus]ASJ76687.1 Lysophospholipid transporter LplT [Granulosicoccus antarcticus IMCC3135]